MAITTTNTITATGTLGLVDTGTNAPIALGASVSGTADTITATGSGTITQSAGTVTGSTSVTPSTPSGSIGTSTSSPLAINTPTLTASASGGNVYDSRCAISSINR